MGNSSNDLFETVFNLSPFGFIIMRISDGKILHANRSAETAFCLMPGEMPGKNSSELGFLNSLKRRTEITYSLKKKGNLSDYPITVTHKSGEKRELSLTIEAIKVEDESCFLISLKDITEIKRSAEELNKKLTKASDDKEAELEAMLESIREKEKAEGSFEKSEHRFRSLVTATSEVLYRMSPDWSTMIQLNGHGFLYDTERESSDWLQVYIHPDDQPHVMAAINEAIKNKSIFELEHRVRQADGSWGWTYSRAVPLMDAEGNIIEWFGAASDFTKRRRAEEKLRESEARLNEAQMLAHVGSYFTDYRCNPAKLEFSEENLRIFGIDPEKETLNEQLILSRIHPDDLWIVSSRNKSVSNGSSSEELEYRIILPDKTIKHLYTKRVIVFDDKGKLLEAFGTTMDITERKSVEAKLKKTLEDLERSNHDLEQFAYIASHDLQEPLRMVSNFTRMLEMKYKDKLDDKANEYMWHIIDGAKRMSSLIHDLLSYSRVTTKAEPFKKSDLNEVLSEVLRDLQVAISETKTEIEIDLMPELYVDAIQIRQLFQNLIQNALKFRNKKNPFIRITARRNGNEWIFAVKDNGIGINPEHYEKIFMLFQRLHDRDKYPGTGLGLAICKKIVERHGGSIWVEANEGHGSIFYFSIPI